MNSEWPNVRLGDLISLRGGLSYKGEDIANDGNSMVTMGCISPSAPFKLSGLKRYKGKFGQQHLLQVGDIVIATRDVTQNRELIGCPAVIPSGLPGSEIIAATNLYKVINASEVKNDFLYWVMKTPQYREQIIASSKGTTVVMLTKDAVENYSFPLPPQKVRDELSKLLNSLNNRINLLRETNKTLEAIAQALFKSWFVDFDPVRAKMEGRQPEGMDEATAALFPDSFEESELGEIPQGWSYCSLKNVVEIFDSKRVPLSGAERSKRQGIYPYYGAAALMDYVDGYLFDGIYLLTGEDGSVADDCGNPITQYVWGKFWVNNHAHILQGNNGVSTEQLMLFLKRTNIQPYITGAVQAKLSQSNMWKINFLNPSRQISEAFGGVVKPLFDSLRQNADIANTLTNLRDALLPRLISGQLRLSEAEAEIEALTT